MGLRKKVIRYRQNFGRLLDLTLLHKITKGGGWWTKERTGGGRGEEEQDGPTEATGERGARLVAQRVAQVLVAQRVAQVGRV